MKQGRATVSGPLDRKQEPMSKAVNPAGVAQLGNHVGPSRAVEPMNAGRGFKAPGISSSTSHCGSQGKR